MADYKRKYQKPKTNTQDLIFGTRAILEAIEAGKEINKIYIKSGIDNLLFKELKPIIQKNQIPYQYVPLEKIERLASQKNHQGLVASISPIHYENIELLLPSLFEKSVTPLIVILDEITDVRNLGAMARSALALGADAIIIPIKGGASISSDAIKTSAGALHHLATCRSKHLPDTLDFLKKSGLQIVACTEKAEKTIAAVDFKLPTALLLGSEDQGISAECLKLADEKTKIALTGPINSLNVSAALSVILYEVHMQRLGKK